MGADDGRRPLNPGGSLPAALVEALLRLCQGDFAYRLPRTLTRDDDDTVAFFFNAIAEELERLITTARTNEARMSALVERLSDALVRVASGDFSIQVDRDYRGDPPDVLVFLVNNTIAELGAFVSAAEHRAEVDRLRLEQLVEARTSELTRLATTDEVTGTLNRRSVLDVAAVEGRRAIRYHHPLCLAMFDVDHFKSINDRHGHSAGDEAIRRVAAVAAAGLRQPDQIGRYGGDEFVIVIPETALAGATRLAERVRAAVEAQEFDVAGVNGAADDQRGRGRGRSRRGTGRGPQARRSGHVPGEGGGTQPRDRVRERICVAHRLLALARLAEAVTRVARADIIRMLVQDDRRRVPDPRSPVSRVLATRRTSARSWTSK